MVKSPDQTVKDLVARLGKFHWSPEHPSTYVKDSGYGLGTIAGDEYGAFNIVWAAVPLNTVEDHVEAIKVFSAVRCFMPQNLGGFTLSECVTISNHQQFADWYRSYGYKINPHIRPLIEVGFDNHGLS